MIYIEDIKDEQAASDAVQDCSGIEKFFDTRPDLRLS